MKGKDKFMKDAGHWLVVAILCTVGFLTITGIAGAILQ